MSDTYLYRRGPVWYWRRPVPVRLRIFFPGRCFKKSTAYYVLHHARTAARALNYAADAVFAVLEQLPDLDMAHTRYIGSLAEQLLRSAFDAILEDGETGRARAGTRTWERLRRGSTLLPAG